MKLRASQANMGMFQLGKLNESTRSFTNNCWIDACSWTVALSCDLGAWLCCTDLVHLTLWFDALYECSLPQVSNDPDICPIFFRLGRSSYANFSSNLLPHVMVLSWTQAPKITTACSVNSSSYTSSYSATNLLSLPRMQQSTNSNPLLRTHNPAPFIQEFRILQLQILEFMFRKDDLIARPAGNETSTLHQHCNSLPFQQYPFYPL